MFFLDDILLSPLTGLLYILREVHHIVQADSTNEAEAIRVRMSELYMSLETGQITEAEADVQEKELLDRLDEIEARARGDDDEESDEAADADDEDRPGETDESGDVEVPGDEPEEFDAGATGESPDPEDDQGP